MIDYQRCCNYVIKIAVLIYIVDAMLVYGMKSCHSHFTCILQSLKSYLSDGLQKGHCMAGELQKAHYGL